jgi:hypothetical protein
MTQTNNITANTTYQKIADGPLDIVLNPVTGVTYLVIKTTAGTPSSNYANTFVMKSGVVDGGLNPMTIANGSSVYVRSAGSSSVLNYVTTTSSGGGGGTVSIPNPLPVSASSALPITTPGSGVATATFTRPADTNIYAIGDLIANSVTAGSVTPMTLAVSRANDTTGMLRKVRVKTNDTAWASKNVRVHFYKNSPTVTNGDNGAWLSTESEYLGYSDILLDRHFSDFEKGFGVASVGSEFIFAPSSGTQNIFALLEARDAVTPGSGKTWTVTVEVIKD